MRTLVCADVHGGHKALVQCLKRSKFNYKRDTLIFLGDLCDGWPETNKCYDELLKIRKLIFVRGNHDQWQLSWMVRGEMPDLWLTQGGTATFRCYLNVKNKVKEQHLKLLESSVPYYLDDKNRLFVHGGILWKHRAGNMSADDLMWNRSLIQKIRGNTGKRVPFYDEVYIGHSTTWHFSEVPYNKENLWCMDQGAGYEGKLSIMDVNTKQFWQSDKVNTLYKTHNGRNIKNL